MFPRENRKRDKPMNTEKIDRRRHYIIVLDTETANTFTDENGRLDTSSTLVYDLGWAVTDKHGNIYRKKSFVNSDIFFHEAELMKSAYYANKIPKYLADIEAGRRIVANTYEMRSVLLNDIADFAVDTICAHNSRFDYNSLNSTERWTTKSKYRYFLPYGITIWDSMKMAQSVIGKMPTYRAFCEEHGYLTKTGRLSMTAENLYRFISRNNDFIESHTGLEDVEIEAQIMAYCFRQHKAMRKKLWE